jgi:predicted thioredoxin/glutaredoxin
MKTNQIMIREQGFVQRTKDDYFNGNELINLWNATNPEKKKLIQNFKSLKETKEYIEQLKKEGIENPYFSKGGRFSDGITWMHPKLFIDFAMWLSVEFKSKVIDMVLDGLIKTRHDAGDYYKEMCATIMESYIDKNGCKPPALIYSNEANMLKQIANLDIDRNEMTEKDLSRLTMLQKVNSTLIKKNIGVDSRKKHLSIINESMM